MADVLNDSTRQPARPVAEQSTAELVQRASEQISRLVRDEMALAKAELAEKGKHAGIGIGLFGTGGVFALYGVGAAIATLIIVFSLFLDLWLAALIVTVLLFLIAGILALAGKSQVTKAAPPEPSAAIASVKADVDEVRQAVRERGRHE
jgi:Putative Actinobacterial Holin-X, holin superfamily III